MAETFDLVVIGAGPGGYVAAQRGARLGLKTALVEKDDRLGGTCLLRGCIPTKALVQASEVWQLCRKGARTFGITVQGAEFDWAKVQKRKSMATVKGAKGVELLMKNGGVTVIHGTARLNGPGQVIVTGQDGDQEISVGKIVLATGSTAAGLPHIQPDGTHILTSDHLLEIDHVPESMIVLGAGAVGVEFATVMQSFGCKVTLIELLPQILPLEDPECAAEVEKALKRLGTKVRTGCRAAKVETSDTGVTVALENTDGSDPQEIQAACVLLAVGRRPVTDNLGLEAVGVELDERGFVVVDEMMQTTAPNIYAIGDIVPTAQLAHLASHEALVAVGHAAGQPLHAIDYNQVPACTYSSPEVASVGLREDTAKAAGRAVTIGKFPFSAVGKASILNEPHGFVKIVSDPDTGRVLGVHMVGPRVTELLGEAVAVLGLEATVESWSGIIHPHPSLSEAVGEAILSSLGMSVHGG